MTLYTCSPAAPYAAPLQARSKRGFSTSRTIDIHCHIEIPAAWELIKELKAPVGPMRLFSNDHSREISHKHAAESRMKIWNVETRLADMDTFGIDIQVLSPAPPQYFYWTTGEVGIATAKTINNGIAEIVANHPERFVGLGTVPLQTPELAVQELVRMKHDLGLRGVEINGNVEGEELSEQRFRPFFAKAEELDMMIFLHPSGYTEGKRMSKYHFINLIGNPLDSTVAVSHLIFGGVLDAYPKLKLCVAHGGGYLAAYTGRMDHGYNFREDCRQCAQLPSSYMKKIYFDSLVYSADQLEYLVNHYGPDRIMLGTDYPYDMTEPDPVGFVESASGLSVELRNAVLGGNAAALLGIDISPGKAE